MKKSQLRIFAIVCLVIAGITFSYATFAYFQTAFSGQVTATIANWSFAFTRDSAHEQSFSQASNYIDLATTCVNCDDGKIKPGSSGSFNVYVDASSSTVDADCIIQMYNLRSTAPGNGIPAGLHFYNEDGTDEISSTNLVSATASAANIIATYSWTAVTANKSATKTVYWEWDYNTANDNAYQGATVTFSLSATATQG